MKGSKPKFLKRNEGKRMKCGIRGTRRRIKVRNTLKNEGNNERKKKRIKKMKGKP